LEKGASEGVKRQTNNPNFIPPLPQQYGDLTPDALDATFSKNLNYHNYSYTNRVVLEKGASEGVKRQTPPFFARFTFAVSFRPFHICPFRFRFRDA
jgi:hypothetical protein